MEKSNYKKLRIRLQLLYNDILEYSRGSFFGVKAMDPDVLNLWFEYNNLLSEFDSIFSGLFNDFHDISYPDPYLATEDSFYREGTMIYKPEHFSQLRNEVAKMIDKLNELNEKKSA